jgi:DNA/RNA endonuclease YhcR with UshA esterase domain
MKRLICWIAGAACGLVIPASSLAAVDAHHAEPRQIEPHQVKQAKEPDTSSTVVKDITVAGTVRATKDNDGNLETVDLVGDDGITYSIEPRGDGVLIAAQSGRRVEVTGRVEERKGKKWMIVGRFKVAP